MSAVDLAKYRSTLEASKRRWTDKRERWATAVSKACQERGRATTAHVRELAGEGAQYIDAWAALDEMTKAGVIECVTEGRRKVWYPAGKIPRTAVARERGHRLDDQVPVLEQMRRGMTDQLVRARGQLHVGRYHLDQARQSIEASVAELHDAGATKYDVLVLVAMVGNIDDGQRSLAVIAGADPTLPPADLRELDEQCEAVRDRDLKSTIHRDSLPYGDLAARVPVAIKEDD